MRFALADTVTVSLHFVCKTYLYSAPVGERGAAGGGYSPPAWGSAAQPEGVILPQWGSGATRRRGYSGEFVTRKIFEQSKKSQEFQKNLNTPHLLRELPHWGRILVRNKKPSPHTGTVSFLGKETFIVRYYPRTTPPASWSRT